MFPLSFLFVDSNKISRVVANMLSNALKFTPEGGTVTILCTVVELIPCTDPEKKYKLLIAVTDTGAGISKVH